MGTTGSLLLSLTNANAIANLRSQDLALLLSQMQAATLLSTIATNERDKTFQTTSFPPEKL